MGQLWVDKEQVVGLWTRFPSSSHGISRKSERRLSDFTVRASTCLALLRAFMSEPITGNHKISGCHTGASGTPFQLEFPAATFFRQQICLRGSADIRFGRIEGRVTREETCVVPPEALVAAAFTPGFEQFGLRINADSMLSKLAALMGAMPSRKLVFDQTTRADSQAIGNLQRMLMFFAAELDALDTKMPSLVVAELEQALIVSFICNIVHSSKNTFSSELAGTSSRGIHRGPLGPADKD
jgi:hypothetical protein